MSKYWQNTFKSLDTWDQLGPIRALSRSLLVKSEFFFFVYFHDIYATKQLSGSRFYFTILSPKAIHSSEHCPRNALSFLKGWRVTLSYVKSYHVLWQSIYSAPRGHPMGTAYHHRWIPSNLYKIDRTSPKILHKNFHKILSRFIF